LVAVHFDTKIAIILDEQLAVWQKAHVTAFLISGIAATDPALVGEPASTAPATHRRCASATDRHLRRRPPGSAGV
jgi:hypothetical protein